MRLERWLVKQRCGVVLFALCLMTSAMDAQSSSAPDGIVSNYVKSEVPSWVVFGGEERMRVESLGGVGYVHAYNSYILNRLRLNLTLTPTSWLKFVFQAQDARVLFTNVKPVTGSQKDPIDLRIGYVQLGNSEKGWFSVTAGRQPVTFGEGRLIGDPDWSNVGKAFDAVRATFHYKKFKLDALSGALDKIYIDGVATPTLGEHFDALYGSLTNAIPNSTIEPYLLWRMEHNVKGEIIKLGNMDEKTAGIRWVGKLPLGLDYGMETAFQRGTQANEPISAWATHFVLGETLPDTKHRPRLFAEINRASGDQNPKDGVHGTFDTLFPASHDKYGFADQFGWANIVHVRGGFQYKVRQDLTLSVAENAFWLANQRDGIYSNGKLIIASNGHEGNFIGHEADIVTRWTSSRTHSVVDLDLGHIFPGEFLRAANHGAGYNFLFLGITQRF